jgi:hypothetical protein
MNMDRVRSPGNGGASAQPGAESLEKTSKKPAKNEKSGNRRTRGSVLENRGNAPTKRGNGRPARAGKLNGRDHASQPNVAQSAPHQPATTGKPATAGKQGNAASVDANGDSAARATDTPAASLPRQASTDRTAYAEVALTLNGGMRPGQTEAVSRDSAAQPRTAMAGPRVSGDQEELVDTPKQRLPGGDAPLPDDIADFVDEIHSRVDLFKVLQDLLNSKDEKIKQRALERILEMKYKNPASGEDPVQIILDGPRPQYD